MGTLWKNLNAGDTYIKQHMLRGREGCSSDREGTQYLIEHREGA
jgi:hypothetical protein